jgi:hypothetical protein
VDAEDLYLDLYANLAENSEYLQADDSRRNLLMETAIVAALAANLGAFASGFFNKLGEQASSAARDRVVSLFRKSSESGKSEPAVEALTILREYLPLIAEISEEERRAEEAWVEQSLVQKGFPAHVAAVVAKSLITRIRQDGGA